MFQEKYKIGLKQYMSQFLGERYAKHQEIIERVAHTIATDNDFSAFMALAVDIYEAAYLKAVDDCREQFDKIGVKVEITGKKV